MGGDLTFNEEFTSKVPAAKLFKATVLEFDTLVPKLMSQTIKSVETIEGDGGPGSIKKMSVMEGGETKSIKHKINALDKEKMTYSYTLIEGDIMNKIGSASHDVKYEATPDGGCKITVVSKYSPKPGSELDQEKVKETKAKAMEFYKGVEAYILANPN